MKMCGSEYAYFKTSKFNHISSFFRSLEYKKIALKFCMHAGYDIDYVQIFPHNFF
jgi:uncharacterized metal-binding protein